MLLLAADTSWQSSMFKQIEFGACVCLQYFGCWSCFDARLVFLYTLFLNRQTYASIHLMRFSVLLKSCAFQLKAFYIAHQHILVGRRQIHSFIHWARCKTCQPNHDNGLSIITVILLSAIFYIGWLSTTFFLLFSFFCLFWLFPYHKIRIYDCSNLERYI